MRVTIIGGEKSLVDGNWDRRMVEHGLEVVAHHHDKNRTKMASIPQTTEGIIVVRDMTRHSMSGYAKDEANQRGIPYAAVPRKWSKAEPILRTQGILPAITNGVKLPPIAVRHELALDYITEARLEGRVPKQDEVFGALQRAFGLKCMFGAKEYSKLCNEAAAQQPLIEAPETPDPYDDAFEWGITLLADRPDLLLDPKDFNKQVLALLGETTKPKRAKAAAFDAAGSVRATWRTDTNARFEAISKWLRNWWAAWKAGTADFPRNREVLEKGKAIFGTSPRNDLMKLARAAVMGDWALEMVELGPGQAYLDSKLATLRPRKADLRSLLMAGDILGYEVVPKEQKRRGRWYTSEAAIDAYITSLTPAKTTAPVSPPMIEEFAKLLAPLATTLADIQTRLKALEDKPVPTVNVDVGVDLVDLNARVKAVQEVVDGLAEKAAQPVLAPVAMGFGPAMDEVVSGVSERQVEISIRPLSISR